jgi:UPF0271 protein
MPHISSANIACGYHAGDLDTINNTIKLAVQNGVAVGAHPGFADKQNFGRTPMHLPDAEIYQLVGEQVRLLNEQCLAAGIQLHHVKPHGALYNMAAVNPAMAAAIAQAIFDVDQQLIMYGLSGSELVRAAQRKGLPTAAEVFADRTYQPDGNLTPRSQPNALIGKVSNAIVQVMQIVNEGKVTSTTGTTIPISAQTLCLHGDGDHAVEFATAIHHHLTTHHIAIKAC